MGSGLLTTKKDGKVPGASERKLHFARQLIQTQDMIGVNFPAVISGFQLSLVEGLEWLLCTKWGQGGKDRAEAFEARGMGKAA